ncbi:MAG: TolC family protein [Acidobacteriota bacterium]|nr:TolC family protein [Blastocatellia bacterium]MDW8413124.1 TolC family protein [Acidobacteriota bacterium]
MFLIFLVVIVIPTIIVSAQSLPQRIGVQEESTRLSIDDCVRMALENNPEVEIERVNIKQLEDELLSAKGSYDPVLSVATGFTRQISPVTNLFGGGDGQVSTGTFTQEFSLRGLLASGMSYGLSSSVQRVNTDNIFVNLNPLFLTQLTAEMRRPLLRNRSSDQARRRVKLLDKQLDLSDLEFRRRIVEVIARVQLAYWDLVYAHKSVEIAEESLRLAREQLARTRRLVEAGAQAPAELVQVEAQLRTREETLLAAFEAVTIAENRLKMQILKREDERWYKQIVPIDRPQLTPIDWDLKKLLDLALHNRLELQQIRLRSEMAKQEHNFFAEQTKPQLDLVASYTLLGAAGRLIDRPSPFATALLAIDVSSLGRVPDFLQGGLGQSLANLFQNRFNTLRVGLQLELPYRNRSAQGQLGKAKHELRKIELQKHYAESIIEAEVRNALQTARTAYERVRASEAAVTAASEQLASEQRRYEAGLSTTFLILTRQQELAEAKGRHLRAVTDYDKALVELRRASGTLMP